jgi:hypothetical protein
MNINGESERGGMVAQPTLYLLGVRAVTEKDRPAPMAERVPTGPRNTSRLRRRLQDARSEVPWIERRPTADGQTSAASFGFRACFRRSHKSRLIRCVRGMDLRP